MRLSMLLAAPCCYSHDTSTSIRQQHEPSLTKTRNKPFFVAGYTVTNTFWPPTVAIRVCGAFVVAKRETGGKVTEPVSTGTTLKRTSCEEPGGSRRWQSFSIQ